MEPSPTRAGPDDTTGPGAVDPAAPGAGPAAGPSLGTPPGLDRLRRHTWWSSVGVLYGIGAFVVVAILATEPLGPLAAVAVAGAACGTLASARLVQRQLPGLARSEAASGEGFPARLGTVALAGGAMTIVAAQWAADGPDTVPLPLIPGLVTGGVAVSVPRRFRIAVVAGGALAGAAMPAAVRYGVTGEVDLAWLATGTAIVAMLAAAPVSGVWGWDVVARLDRARRVEGELAVAEERLRFAADLHDVQGHHLQVIALKSELATRLVEADPGAAGAHMQEAHEHALAALHDTRAVVHGYRRASLGAELANTTRVLAAAGIDGRLDGGAEGAADAVPEGGRYLLGLVAREATTNVLRHSRAGEARLALDVEAGWARLRVRNDGAAAPAADGAAATAVDGAPGNGVAGRGPAAVPGTGLTALAERLGAAGGTLEWGREGDWFTVTARVPVEEHGQ